MIAYEQQLSGNLDWALREGSMHFEKDSAVHKTLRRIAQRLEQMRIPYAVVGGMAMFFHGYRRFTEDVDILVTADGLAEIHRQLEGLGYVPPFEGSKQLRDTDSGVRIEFLVTGAYPGDGKPKPIAFPDPAKVGEEIDGVRCLTLRTLIELKLASSMAPGRRKDLGDVQELIRLRSLPKTFAEELDSSVRPLFLDLWNEVQSAPPHP